MADHSMALPDLELVNEEINNLVMVTRLKIVLLVTDVEEVQMQNQEKNKYIYP